MKLAQFYLARALQLADRGRYSTQPNPRVGCVIVKAGEIVGEGFHQAAGEAHAEIMALAQAGPGTVTEDDLHRLLQESGIRIIIRELRDAPRLLQEWDLLEPADGGYRFRVELLRRWIADHYPLQIVQQELDYIQPAAENLYQAARNLYQGGQFEQSVPLLEQALGLNPNHQRAGELLSEIYLSQGKIEKAQQILERLAEIPGVERPQVVKSTSRMSWFVYVIRLASEIDRNAVMSQLHKLGISCRPYFTPIHLQPFYVTKYGYAPGDFPITEAVSNSTLALPFHNHLDKPTIDFVCNSLKQLLS